MMLPTHRKTEIDLYSIRLIVGLIPLSLAFLTDYFAQNRLQSISAAYYEGGWSRDIFVGFLFAISAFLVSYNGRSARQMVLSKIAAFAALGVAMFPCKCGCHTERIPHMHGICAAVMFLILAFFCYEFLQRAWGKDHWQAKVRACIYGICGITILASVLIIATDIHSKGTISSKISRIIFFSENAALVAFGIAWLTACQMIPIRQIIRNMSMPVPLFGDRSKKTKR